MHTEGEPCTAPREEKSSEWRRPILRKLPIKASNGVGPGNEGQGHGKGGSGPTPHS